MIIIKINGGLGNQMFQYAAGKSLSVKNKTIIKLDLTRFKNIDPEYRKYELGHFNIKENFSTPEDLRFFNKTGLSKLIENFKPYYKRLVVKYRGYDFDPHILKLKGNVCLDGYWQSEKYFKDVANAIKQEYTLKNGLGVRSKEIFEKIINTNSVSLHIRRGDYLSGKFSGIYPVLPMEYYQEAINLIANKTDNPIFFVFSDDIGWTKNNLKISYPVVYVSGNNIEACEEIILMSKCRHNIIANSSFSWWGAWLNHNPDKIVIAPRYWLKVHDYNINDLVPEEWIKI